LEDTFLNKAEMGHFLDFISSLRQSLPLSIPLMREVAALAGPGEANPSLPVNGILWGRINRSYLRLCRIQEDLEKIDFAQAAPGVIPEEYVFSRINFGRYREIKENEFDVFFLEGIKDFDEEWWIDNFSLGRNGIKTLLENSYANTKGIYQLKKESPLILSVMRTLDTSMEIIPLLGAEEIHREMENLSGFLGPGRYHSAEGQIRENPGNSSSRQGPVTGPNEEHVFSILIRSFDNVTIRHEDGMETKLFVNVRGDLSGTFRPKGKPWTRVLISGS
jgi:hypothetical protein